MIVYECFKIQFQSVKIAELLQYHGKQANVLYCTVASIVNCYTLRYSNNNYILYVCFLIIDRSQLQKIYIFSYCTTQAIFERIVAKILCIYCM